jgi:hypothetical protein
MGNKYYTIVENNYEYNDENYNQTGYLLPKELFTNKEKAIEFAKLKIQNCRYIYDNYLHVLLSDEDLQINLEKFKFWNQSLPMEKQYDNSLLNNKNFYIYQINKWASGLADNNLIFQLMEALIGDEMVNYFFQIVEVELKD